MLTIKQRRGYYQLHGERRQMRLIVSFGAYGELMLQLFAIHDIDCGGALSFEEFLSFIVVYDPSCEVDGVKETFTKCASDDVMDTFEFYGTSTLLICTVAVDEAVTEWVVRTFGDLDDNEYQKGEVQL